MGYQFLDDFWPQVESQKSIILRKIDVESRLEEGMDRRWHKNFEKDQHRGVEEAIFDANGVQHGDNTCASRPNIYRSAWPLALLC